MNQTDGSRFLFLVAPAKERVKELVSKRKPGAARPPCVVRDAPSALLTMTYVIDSIEKPPHPRPAPGQALRKPQRGCLEGRTVPTQPSFNSRTRPKSGVQAPLVRCQLPPVQARGGLWVSAFAGRTEKRCRTKCERTTRPQLYRLTRPPPSGRAWVEGEGLCQRGGPVSAPPFVLPSPRSGRVGVGVMRAECIDSVTAAAAIAALIRRC